MVLGAGLPSSATTIEVLYYAPASIVLLHVRVDTQVGAQRSIYCKSQRQRKYHGLIIPDANESIESPALAWKAPVLYYLIFRTTEGNGNIRGRSYRGVGRCDLTTNKIESAAPSVDIGERAWIISIVNVAPNGNSITCVAGVARRAVNARVARTLIEYRVCELQWRIGRLKTLIRLDRV